MEIRSVLSDVILRRHSALDTIMAVRASSKLMRDVASLAVCTLVSVGLMDLPPSMWSKFPLATKLVCRPGALLSRFHDMLQQFVSQLPVEMLCSLVIEGEPWLPFLEKHRHTWFLDLAQLTGLNELQAAGPHENSVLLVKGIGSEQLTRMSIGECSVAIPWRLCGSTLLKGLQQLDLPDTFLPLVAWELLAQATEAPHLCEVRTAGVSITPAVIELRDPWAWSIAASRGFADVFGECIGEEICKMYQGCRTHFGQLQRALEEGDEMDLLEELQSALPRALQQAEALMVQRQYRQHYQQLQRLCSQLQAALDHLSAPPKEQLIAAVAAVAKRLGASLLKARSIQSSDAIRLLAASGCSSARIWLVEEDGHQQQQQQQQQHHTLSLLQDLKLKRTEPEGYASAAATRVLAAAAAALTRLEFDRRAPVHHSLPVPLPLPAAMRRLVALVARELEPDAATWTLMAALPVLSRVQLKSARVSGSSVWLERHWLECSEGAGHDELDEVQGAEAVAVIAARAGVTELTVLTYMYSVAADVLLRGVSTLVRVAIDAVLTPDSDVWRPALDALACLCSLRLVGEDWNTSLMLELPARNRITRISIAAFILRPGGWRSIARLTGLQQLTVQHDLGDVPGEDIARALCALSQLSSLSLHGLHCDTETWRLLARLPGLCELALCTLVILGEAPVPALPCITRLFGDSAAHRLDAMDPWPPLQMGADIRLADMLPGLRELRWDGGADLQQLADALQGHPAVERVSCQYPQAPSPGAAWRYVWHTMPALQTVELAHAFDSLWYMLSDLCSCTSLRSLKLTSRQMSQAEEAEGGWDVASAEELQQCAVALMQARERGLVQVEIECRGLQLRVSPCTSAHPLRVTEDARD
jgi:hypothetical protein